ncbi:MAG: hydrogenase maturation protease [Anaerolineales bacterium]|nr:hydrogenase maturation protease [Anaerolineales bacterium]
MKTIIVGLGNPILTDDGVGVKVAQQLEKIVDRDAHPDLTIPEASVGGLRLMETLLGFDRVILIDAYYLHPETNTPGTIHRLTLDDLRSVTPTQHSTSAHDTSLVIALDAADKLGYKIPRNFSIYAIEVENILEFSETPTPAVARAIPIVTEQIISELSLKIR